jgi:hypothetical protein
MFGVRSEKSVLFPSGTALSFLRAVFAFYRRKELSVGVWRDAASEGGSPL